MDNKRRNERFNCIVPVESKEGSIFDKTKTIDISKGGLGFISQNVIPLNQEVAIEIDLTEDGEPVFVIGKVQWVRPIANSEKFRIGVSFDKILKGSKSRLDKYFKK